MDPMYYADLADNAVDAIATSEAADSPDSAQQLAAAQVKALVAIATAVNRLAIAVEHAVAE